MLIQWGKESHSHAASSFRSVSFACYPVNESKILKEPPENRFACLIYQGEQSQWKKRFDLEMHPQINPENRSVAADVFLEIPE